MKGTEVSLSYVQCFLYLVSSLINVFVIVHGWIPSGLYIYIERERESERERERERERASEQLVLVDNVLKGISTEAGEGAQKRNE